VVTVTIIVKQDTKPMFVHTQLVRPGHDSGFGGSFTSFSGGYYSSHGSRPGGYMIDGYQVALRFTPNDDTRKSWDNQDRATQRAKRKRHK
jgi:hypothetical protein